MLLSRDRTKNLRKCSGDLRKSSEMMGNFGNLWVCSGDLRKSSNDFVWPSIIFGKLNFIGWEAVQFFPKFDSLCVFTQSPY